MKLSKKAEKVDLVLLDIEMPNMDGFETFRQMKEFADGIPVIFLTASGLEDDVVNAINTGSHIMHQCQFWQYAKSIC